jgi:hypothetical protein
LPPKVLIGRVMPAPAYRYLPEDGLFDAVCRTAQSLRGAIGILKPCAVENGYLGIRFKIVTGLKEQPNLERALR